MNELNPKNQNPNIPPWLLTGEKLLIDLIDMFIENSPQRREVVMESIHLFFEIIHEKLKDGHSISLSFGTFIPQFGEIDPITGEAELTVQFVPTKEMLLLLEKKRLERLNNFPLN